MINVRTRKELEMTSYQDSPKYKVLCQIVKGIAKK